MKATVESREENKVATAKNLKSMCDRDREKVKGIFKFYECEGGVLSFSFKAYKWDNVERYSFVDGEVYEIPLGVAKHLNKNGWYPVHSYMMDKDGKALMRMGQKKRRFGFQSLEFIDPEEIGESRASEIVTVQQI
jgi:hypothetical protein